jgi:hypothetical protein
MKNNFLKGLCLAGLFAGAPAIAAEDVGLVNHLAGEVRHWSGGSSAQAAPFMKVREGDRFQLAPGAQLRVVYFRSGRHETHAGPATLVAGSHQSTVQAGSQPRVALLPAGVPQRISQTPELVQIAKLGRAGGVTVRGVPREQRLTPHQQAELRQARQTYQQLRQSASPDDITAELYLYSVLQDYLLYTEMKEVVEEMQRRQPDNNEIADMAEYVTARTQAR